MYLRRRGAHPPLSRTVRLRVLPRWRSAKQPAHTYRSTTASLDVDLIPCRDPQRCRSLRRSTAASGPVTPVVTGFQPHPPRRLRWPIRPCHGRRRSDLACGHTQSYLARQVAAPKPGRRARPPRGVADGVRTCCSMLRRSGLAESCYHSSRWRENLW